MSRTTKTTRPRPKKGKSETAEPVKSKGKAQPADSAGYATGDLVSPQV
jgi:hypothetical protein